MILGDFQFKIKSLSQRSLEKKVEFKWAEIERIGDLPFLQNLGKSRETVTIEGAFYPKFSDNYKALDDLKNSDLCKKANNLITDAGEILGKFVIVSIEETQEFFDEKGVPKKIEFNISLSRVPDGQSGGALNFQETNTGIVNSFFKF